MTPHSALDAMTAASAGRGAQLPCRVLLLAGIPASGKTTYGTWLAAKKGWFHVDLERPGALEAAGLRAAWVEVCRSAGSTAGAFVGDLRSRGRNAVLDWGFPPSCLPIVRALVAAGVEAWWLDGDRDAALASYQARGTGSIDAWRAQLNAIDRNWPAIAELVGPRVIRTVEPGPRHVDGPDFYALIASPKT